MVLTTALLEKVQGPDLSREVMGSWFGAQGAASTHWSPHTEQPQLHCNDYSRTQVRASGISALL